MSTLARAQRKSFASRLPISGLLAEDLDYHLVRASMVLIFLFFGYQKWFAYESSGWSRSSATGR